MVVPLNKPVVCPVVIGRTTELTAIHQLIESTKSGQGQVALLSGEAGIGKSRLVLRSLKGDRIKKGGHLRERRQDMPKILRVRAPQDEKEEKQVRKLAGSRHGPADWILHARIVARSWDVVR